MESLVVRKQFGEDAAETFWKVHAEMYLLTTNGKANLLEDANNPGIAYSKGAWIFRMLEDAIGPNAFDRAVTDFSLLARSGRAGWEVLAGCAQRHTTSDIDIRAFLEPWLKGSRAPRLRAEVRGRAVTIVQEEPQFRLPVVVAASTSDGQQRRRIWLIGPATTVSFSDEASDVRIDPDASVLLRR